MCLCLFFVLFAYLYAYVLFGVLNLSKNLSVKISFLVFYAIFTLIILYVGFGATLILAVPVIILFILILKRKQCFTKLKLTMASAGLLVASACLLVITWQLEVPQKVIVNLLPVKLEIVNDDFEYIENPDIDSNLYFEEEKTKKFLNFTYSKINIYACDDFKCKENNRYACDGFGCKGNKKYVGFYWEPWSDASTLGCIFTIINTGSCMRSINRNKRGRDYLMSFIENRKQKNKGKNNE
ncbi:hypothetical protein [Campylobacter sp.]|uniref:hypothetical protein n=1 Tax=Campylobacter sp. TaxID=205 RepID=UPI002AA7CAB7|nr:hypothetical protein [Campylobacter sp.]MCI7076274.1 hypothetical protein [Campylobacter sp.]